jgi:hypothetical protein
MTKPVLGLRATGHPVTSGGAPAISMRLVHRPSTTRATTKRTPVGAYAAKVATTRKVVAYSSSILRARK